MRALLALLLAPVLAQAAPVPVQWDNPTQFDDGTALAASSITRTRVEYGTCAGVAFGTKQGEFIVTGSATSGTSPNLAAGTYCFRAYTTAAGQESIASGVAQAVVAPPKPNPPSNLRAVAQVAYTVIKQTDRFVMLPVGTVPADTACDTTQGVNGYYVVPRRAVAWSGNVRPEVVVAQCG